MTTRIVDKSLGPVDAALIKRVNRLFHDLTQSVFDFEHRHRHRAERAFWERVAKLIPDPADRMGKGFAAMDLACGTGFVTRILGRRLGPSDSLIAVDASESAMKTTRQKWAARGKPKVSGPQLRKLVGDGQRLALANESINLVAMNASLHHVPNPKAVLREIDRVLKPGGWFALGFEPNRTHFASIPMAALSQGMGRAAWYASPRQNWRRLGSCMRFRKAACGQDGTSEQDVLAACINERLRREEMIAEPLSTDSLLDLVDPHARGAEEAAGFDPVELLNQSMPDYRVHELVSSDYLGEIGRRSVVVRKVVDGMFRMILPRHGSLFSWVVRKPDSSGLEVH